MKSLVKAKIAAFTSLLMTHSPASYALTEQNTEHLCFGMGIFLGILITLLLGLYLTRYYRQKYQKMLQHLKLAKSNVKIAEKTMITLAKEQQDSQDLLEERVQERTLELNIALQELESANQELERKNVLDELTGLHNRRFYDQKIVAEYRRSRRNLTALSLVLIDVDLFKSVNDTHGHLAGDQCLIWLANHIKQSLKRSTDRAFRYGGEEFCLILPNTDAQGALLFAEQLRLQVNEQAFQFRDIEIPLTISCGISTYQQQVDIGPEQIFSGADNALYQAKHNGRNQTKQHIFTE
jgi:diguanylate cyclase (GGDEF)-like protein